MSKTFGLIVASLLTVSIPAPSASAQSTPHSVSLDIIHGKPYVMVMVNGRGPFRFVIDTGTGGDAFVTKELAEQLGLAETGQILLRDPSGSGTRRVPMVALASLEVAGVEFTGVKAAVHGLSEGDGDCQGLLGFRLFRDYLLTLDYPNRRLELVHGELATDGGKQVLAFRMPDGIPIVSLDVGGTQLDALLDSGGTGLSLPDALASRLKFSSEAGAFGNAHSLATSFKIKAAYLASDVQLGEYTFRQPFVEINPAFPLANFGSCPMQGFALTFDQKNDLVRFESARKVLRLSPTPGPVRLVNAPPALASDSKLVPVG